MDINTYKGYIVKFVKLNINSNKFYQKRITMKETIFVVTSNDILCI